MLFSPLPCYLASLRTKYSPYHPILQHPQHTFLPEYERPCFTPVRNSQNYSYVHLNFIILDSKLENSYSTPNDSKHPLPQSALNFLLNGILIH